MARVWRDLAMTVTPERPRLAVRVGITGARSILPEQEARVCEQIADVLHLIRQEVALLARMTEARQAYRTDAAHNVVPTFRFISPLAEGADRLAARIAYGQGWKLDVPMPFHRTEYEWDFKQKENLDEFRALLALAGDDTLELDGGRDDPARDRYDEARSYEAVGRFVARNCDLLIAVWDGRPGRGRGGTADIVQFAADIGPPVWWIRADRIAPPMWINEASDVRDAKPQAGEAEAELAAFLQQLILPPKFTPEPAASLIDRLARLGCPPSEPLAAFFAETPLPRHWWTSANIRLLKLFARGYEQKWQEPPAPDARHPVATYWHEAYEPPNGRAGEYAARYRSTYVWVFVCAAMALICAAVALAEPGLAQYWHGLDERGWVVVKGVAIIAELLALLLILRLVVVNIRHEWLPRSIDYRLLAELYRKQQALAVLGWSLSGRAVQALGEQHSDDTPPPERAAWLIWLFAAMSRAAPMLHGVFDAARSETARTIILRDLVNEQANYHEGRETLSERAGGGFAALGTLLFFTVIIVVVVKILLLVTWTCPALSSPLGLLATVLPALTAAAIGVRAYAELELLADQSRRMKTAMVRASQRITKLDLTRPVASQELGVEVLAVTSRMLQDTEGWVRLARVKLVEAG
jgi:hypothetical protein